MRSNPPPWDSLWTNGRIATMRANGVPYGAIENAALAVKDGRIAWLGPMADVPADQRAAAREVHNLVGRWVTPGLIDCHTHLVYGGDRAHEFELRLGGATYEEIARAGGGIRSTVTATRAASEDQLIAAADTRLSALQAEGVTVVEIKSGYGLDTETELKLLRAARALGRRRPVTVRTTFLGAHALPPEYDGRADAYRHDHRGDASRGSGRQSRRRSRCLLREDRLHAGADGAAVRRGDEGRALGEAACRPAVGPRRRGARRALSGALRRSSGIHLGGRRWRHGQGRHCCGAAAR